MTLLRYLWRTPLLIGVMLLAVPAALLAQSRWAQRRKRHGEALNLRVVRWWAGALLHVLGIRVQGQGTPLADPVMFVANHVSWLDIVLLHSQRAVCFVAKAEIAHWPLIGWMAAHAGTIFHRRGSNDSMQRVLERMTERLEEGRAVAAFPEGSTGPVGRVRVFHARIMQAAVAADVPVQPVALRYTRDGQMCTEIAFRRGENFFANGLRLLGAPPMRAEVIFLAPLDEREHGRKAMAVQARARIAAVLEDE